MRQTHIGVVCRRRLLARHIGVEDECLGVADTGGQFKKLRRGADAPHAIALAVGALAVALAEATAESRLLLLGRDEDTDPIEAIAMAFIGVAVSQDDREFLVLQ